MGNSIWIMDVLVGCTQLFRLRGICSFLDGQVRFLIISIAARWVTVERHWIALI
ncbi:hypothetical protein AXX17_AT4G03070 [Arabidopsis thaliana]|uniref:Uncharacterized protein n=1 Tax=Arabidopsis thaliana TaxID=3702 RepID=A0A178V3G7_ARATH|nr:hypothetical protein AXX17_AT4G03070 [Arabidopsis thaliana]